MEEILCNKNSMLKKLPIGIQTFSEIIEGEYLYIDKTKDIYDLVNRYKYVFLSRPRRFGKSLLLDTLNCLFSGEKELFKGLYIEDKWDFSKKYPVIKISFSGDLRSEENLKNRILITLKGVEEELEIKCESNSYDSCFGELIRKAYEKYGERVVILIDEYDKAILDNLDQEKVAEENREILKAFYSIIKDNDRYIKFAFLTGVSKFSKASIFSGLNMLEDISLYKRYGNICGITQEELEENFKDYLKEAEEEGISKKRIKEWYNGYYFLKDKIYNPFDILKFFNNGNKFENYWFNSGTPSFLIKLIKKNNYFLPRLSDLVLGKELLETFDIDKIKLEVLLFQSGYLTIEKEIITLFETIQYKLKIPNREVRTSLFSYIGEYIYSLNNELETKNNIYLSLLKLEVEKFIKNLKQVFSGIPYNNYTKNEIAKYEGYWSSLVYVYLQSLGLDISGEDVTNMGRIDLSILIENKVYILEFKMKNIGEEPLKQVKEKKYYEKYLGTGKEIYLVGVVFDEENRNILNSEWERVKI